MAGSLNSLRNNFVRGVLGLFLRDLVHADSVRLGETLGGHVDGDGGVV